MRDVESRRDGVGLAYACDPLGSRIAEDQIEAVTRSAEKRLSIINELGLHARAAALFVKTANKFESDIQVERDGIEVNGKSIMGVLMLKAAQGTYIDVRAVGEDAESALAALEELVANRFGEES